MLPSGEVIHLTDMKDPQTIHAAPEIDPVSKHEVNAESSTIKTPTQEGKNTDHVDTVKIQGERDLDPSDTNHPQPSASHEALTEQKELPVAGDDEPSAVSIQFSIVKYKAGLIVDQIPPQDRELLGLYFSPEVMNEILSLYSKVVKIPGLSIREYGTVQTAAIDREKRGRIHQSLRTIFKSKLESRTDEDGRLIISAMPKQPGFYTKSASTMEAKKSIQTKKSSEPRGQALWDKLGGEYLHFSLYKENKDTMEAVAFLCRELKIKAKDFAYAGTKDRRGVTVQRISVHRINVNRLMNAGKALRGVYIGNFEYHPKPLHLGELTGNEFVITLRDCKFHHPSNADNPTVRKGAETIVRESIQSFAEKGFINYYGLQRFGTFDYQNQVVGAYLLRGEFQYAVETILYYKERCLLPELSNTSRAYAISQDDRARAAGIHTFLTTGNPVSATLQIPRKFSAETSIIRHLGQKGQDNDFFGAMLSIARNHRLLYIHAYQSYIWNFAASHRWKLFGPSVVEGDLVLVNEHKVEAPTMEQEVDADGEIVVQAGVDDRSISLDERFERARALTAEEACSGKYTIYDVVLPGPGYDVTYPQNELGVWYRNFMDSMHGGGIKIDEMRRPQKEFSLSGCYRKVLTKPNNVSFEVKEYLAEDEQFVETDLERYLKAHPNEDRQTPNQTFAKSLVPEHTADQPASSKTANATDSAPNSKKSWWLAISKSPVPEVDTKPKEDKKIAVVIKMQLASSQYATVALRELTKQGGIKHHQPEYAGGH